MKEILQNLIGREFNFYHMGGAFPGTLLKINFSENVCYLVIKPNNSLYEISYLNLNSIIGFSIIKNV